MLATLLPAMFTHCNRGLRQLYSTVRRPVVTVATPAGDPVTRGKKRVQVEGDDELPLERVKFFSKLMGFKNRKAVLQFLNLHDRLMSKPLVEITKSLKTLDELGIERCDALANAKILTLFPNTLRKRFQCLSEIGFRSVGTPELVRYHQLMAYTAPTLQKCGALSADVEPLQFVLKNSPLPDKLKNLISSKHELTTKMSLQALRSFIIAEVVQYYFQCDRATSTRLSQYSTKASINYVLETARILRDELQVPFSKITKNPMILGIDPKAIISLMKLCRGHGLDLKDIVNASTDAHLVLIKEPEQFSLICRYFINFGVPLKSVASMPTLFLFSAEYIMDGLTVMSLWPEFPVIKLQPSFCTLLRSYKQLSSINGKFPTKSEQDVDGSKEVFTDCDAELNRLLGHCGEQSGKAKKVRGKRAVPIQLNRYVFPYLTEQLPCTKQDVRINLCQHPLYTKTTLVNMSATLTFLLKAGFEPQQIVHGLSLLLHPKARVEEFLQQLPTLELAQPFNEWEKSPYILQLLLYAIEKEDRNLLLPMQSCSISASASEQSNEKLQAIKK